MGLRDQMQNATVELPTNLPDQEYFDNSSIGSSDLKRLIKEGPLDFYHHKYGEHTVEETMPMKLGTLIHTYLLLPEEFESTYEIFDGKEPNHDYKKRLCELVIKDYHNRISENIGDLFVANYSQVYNTKKKSATQIEKDVSEKYNELCGYVESRISSIERDVILVSSEDVNLCEEIADNYSSNELLRDLQNKGQNINEQVFFGQLEGIDCKIKPDNLIYEEGVAFHINDLKTASKAGPDSFGKDFRRWGYHYQSAFYSLILENTDWYQKICDKVGKRLPIYNYITACQKESPYSVYLYQVKNETLEYAKGAVINALQQLSTVYGINSRNNPETWTQKTLYTL